MTSHDEHLLDAQDVADILQVSRNTVYNLVKAGELSSYMVGRKMRFTLRDVDAYIDRLRGATIGDVAAETGLSESTIRRAIDDGWMPATMISHKYYFDMDKVREAIEEKMSTGR